MTGPEAEAAELRTLLAIQQLRGEVVERLVAVETRLEGVESLLAQQVPAPVPARGREATRAGAIGAAAAGAMLGLGELIHRYLMR